MGRKSSTLPGQYPWEEILKPGRTRRPKRPRLRPVVRILSYLLVVPLVLGLVGGALYVYAQLKLKANSKKIPALVGQKPKEPMNVLVLGSDSRASLPPEEQDRFDPGGQDRNSGQRADTIALVHVDEERDQAVVVHFPRDLRVEYPDGKLGKINGLYQQGPNEMVKAVQAFTGLPIHHYVETNFVGFLNIVNALGGVDVQFERPIQEDDSGLDVPAGCVNLTGDQALAFVRVRKIDDDFGRIARQQLFVRLMMEKVTSAKTYLNPVKVLQLVNLFADNVTTDADLSLGDMKNLALRLRNFDPARVDMRVVPSSPQTINRVSYVIANEQQSGALFEALRERRPLPDYGRTGVSAIAPADVRVNVLNGTGVKGLAAKAADEIKSKGFQVTGKIGNAEDVLGPGADPSGFGRTTVFYRDGNQEKASMVAGPFGAEIKPLPERATPLADAEVVIVMGRDYAEGKATPPPPPPPSGKPEPKPLIHPCE